MKLLTADHTIIFQERFAGAYVANDSISGSYIPEI